MRCYAADTSELEWR